MTLELILKILILSINKINRILELELFRKNLDVEQHKLFVEYKLWFLHKLEHQKIGNIEDFGLKLEIETDEVHALDGPLSVVFGLVSLIKSKGLVLLLQELGLSHVGEEESLA